MSEIQTLEIKLGAVVQVIRHRCGTDVIGPFIGTILDIDNDDPDIVCVIDPEGIDWWVELWFLEPVGG